MFGNKKLKERIAKLEAFEKSVSTVIDNYFATNEKHELKFSTESSADKFYHFVTSVDKKLKKLVKTEEENEELKEELAKEQEAHEHFVEMAKKKVEEQNAIIKAQEKEIKELAEERSVLQIQLIAKNRQNANAKSETAKKGKK